MGLTILLKQKVLIMADQASPFILDIKNILYAAVKQSNSWVTEMEIFFKSPKIEGQAFNQTSLGKVKNMSRTC